MAVATRQMPNLPLSEPAGSLPLDEEPELAPETVQRVQSSSISTVNDLFLSKVRGTPDAVFIQYPATTRGKSDYVSYMVADIDRFADEAARKYAASGLSPNSLSPEAEVVALLASSNLDYVISILALSRMGFAILFLSTRLSTEAYLNLLLMTNCHKIVVGNNNAVAVKDIQGKYALSSFDIVTKNEYDLAHPSGPRFPAPIHANAAQQIAFIIHSSGSTGLPKPIFQTHGSCLANYSSGIPYKAFLTLPLFHNHGISTVFRALVAGKQIGIYNANLPLSGSTLVESMQALKPESLHCVPYALKLLSETHKGIDALKKLKLVLFGGSSCPDDLGDRLVDAGVYLVGHYGSTEVGQLLTSFRDPRDKAWNYMRPLASAKPFLKWVPRGDDIFECVVLDGLASKVQSNSDDPPNSFYTKDTFVAHPTIPDAWKYLGRIDDRVTLVNGEKVLPIPYEHAIRQHDLVQEAVVFGVGRAIPGLIIVPGEKATSMAKIDILQALVPTIDIANSRAEEFGRIPLEMIEILDVGTEYPRTDKGTVIRAAFYRMFADLIDSIYVRFETPELASGKSLLTLEYEQLVTYLLDLFRTNIGISYLQPASDFFEGGIDSRQAITARAQIARQVDVGGHTLGSNVVFEYPSVELLAKYLYSLRTGEFADKDDDLVVMAQLIDKYSNFESRTSGSLQPQGETILLTGATGSLGAHILDHLLRERRVKHIYCLVRASSSDTARKRVLSALEAKGIFPLQDHEISRVSFLSADLSLPSLGLSQEVLYQLNGSLTTVIHSAWAVNFNLGVRSFEGHHIRGVHNLLNLCLGVKTADPARFYFCSSISAAAGTPLPATIDECHIENLSHAQKMGYAQSKLVTEHIVKAAGENTGMTASVLRLGQIVGDTHYGNWNTTEAIPLMLQSVKTVGALPALDETPSWMPVNLMGKAVVELSGVGKDNAKVESDIYNVQNSRLFHWTRDLLPALREAGLEFKTVSQREWVELLRNSDPNPETNPTIKLLEFFTAKYDNDRPGRQGLQFVTRKTEEASETMQGGFDVVGSGLVSKMVDWWKTQW